ncbi:MAG: hypothetical protein GX640_08905 [Fibrobacter sp.]|nr:hypothetical protein [Fibrobacter sp.]
MKKQVLNGATFIKLMIRFLIIICICEKCTAFYHISFLAFRKPLTNASGARCLVKALSCLLAFAALPVNQATACGGST